MGAWSGEPFGNDTAADWAWELDEVDDWSVVLDALTGVVGQEPGEIDADDATVAIAAAEVVAHYAGRPTQSDAYTESVTTFVGRVVQPPAEISTLALGALDAATSPDGELAELWAEDGSDEWAASVARLRAVLAEQN